MPFVDSSRSVVARLHLSDASPGVLVGIAALVLVAVLAAGSNLVAALEGGPLVVEKASSQDEGATDVPDAQAGETPLADGQPQAGASSEAQSVASSMHEPVQTIMVFVSGEVANPGVYELEGGARAVDALEAAGGFGPDAARDAVNLARALSDGEQLDIPTDQEVEEGAWNQEAAHTSGSEGSDGEAQADGASSGLVNINTASEEELQRLPGIGPSTAAKIVASREAEGPFASVDELVRVSGIGQKKLAALADLACV